MTEKLNYLECWISVATSLFAQALSGEPAMVDALPKPMAPGSFGFSATIKGDESGRFSIMLEGGIVEDPLLGEGVDQKAGWAELLKEVIDAACGELLAKTGRKVQAASFAPIDSESKLTRCFQLKSGDRLWLLQIFCDVKQPAVAKPAVSVPSKPVPPAAETKAAMPKGASQDPEAGVAGLSPGLALLLDVELEASLRFGAREMPLGELLDLGPGDVIQLDRHISDPVDLIVGDKIVARGEVVLMNGNFGLRVTEVAEPQRRLESIRCLF